MPDHFYVYPAYVDRSVSRSDGRRVPAGAGVADVTAEEIAAAAKKLGYKAEVEANKQYPRRFFDYTGRVKVAKRPGATKEKFLRALAEELARARGPGAKK
ncbi:MAG TPA: signal recognition particle subunit SRP19/SEC65 family protein [Thermoplasmata archaeon]|nr:signal recognition particle subunit SRP19/SEC65 family protein [Thermoplasmata archaeon]